MTTEPMTNTDRGLARVVTSLEHQVNTTPAHRGRVDLYDVLGLVETMRAIAGSEQLDADIERIQAASNAIDAAVADMADYGRHTTGLLDIDPAEVRERVRQAAFERNARESLAYTVSQNFQDRLAASAADLLTKHCDTVVTKMRVDFDKHLKVVRTAHELGISDTTNAAGLVESASPETIEAFRALPRAVAGLDQVAGLRTQMAAVLRYGPTTPPVACFLAKADAMGMQGAWNAWTGETEIVQYNSPYVGSTLTQVHRQRVGGAWLALVSSGHSLRLNTAAETSKVLSTAREAA